MNAIEMAHDEDFKKNLVLLRKLLILNTRMKERERTNDALADARLTFNSVTEKSIKNLEHRHGDFHERIEKRERG